MDRFSAMEAFVRVVEAGSFCAAARQLRVGQPLVSKMIARLEARLQARLLLRSTHGLTLTEVGQRCYEATRRALDEVEEAEQAAGGAAAALSGRLRISAAVAFARLHVIPRLPLFLARHPGLTVDVIVDDRSIDLIEAGVDIALHRGSLSDSTLTARRIGSSRRLVLGRPPTLSGPVSRRARRSCAPTRSWCTTSEAGAAPGPFAGRARMCP